MLQSSNLNVLVTGANGFIGQRLTSILQNHGLVVHTLMRQQINHKNHYSIDLAFEDCPPALCEGIDTVFHLAGKAHALADNGRSIEEYRQINTEGTRKLLEAARKAGVKRFVYFSSVKAVGDSPLQPMDETLNMPPDTPYGQSKYDAEQLVLYGNYVPNPVVLRPCLVYGNTDKGNLPRMIKAIRRGMFPPLPELHNRRSMVHVEDLVRAALLAAEKPEAAGQIYIVSDEQDYSTRQLYDWIRAELGKAPTQMNIPLSFIYSLAKMGDTIGRLTKRRFMFDSDALYKLTGSACYSSAKIARELGFRPQHTLQQSLPEIIRYLKLI